MQEQTPDEIMTLMAAMGGNPLPVSVSGVSVPYQPPMNSELKQKDAENKVIALLNEASAAMIHASPHQDVLDSFNEEIRELLRKLPQLCSQALNGGIKKTLPRIFLAMPRYGTVERESDIALFCHATKYKNTLTVVDKNTSALPASFNDLWCDFLNDGTFDYFAMLHSDVSPSVDWVDTLIEELEKYNLDIIHAPCAIKDDRSLTSTAVGVTKDEPGLVGRRITIEELQFLPETFTVEDCVKLWEGDCSPDPIMLPNTGCMIVKYGEWCRKFPGFRFLTRIVEKEGKFRSEFDPEDWGFGRWATRNNLKVGACRKVVTTHYGRMGYPSDRPWGDKDRDEAYFFYKENGKTDKDTRSMAEAKS